MQHCQKKAIFYTLLFVLFFVFAEAAIYIGEEHRTPALLIAGAVYSVVICSLHQALLAKDQVDGFHFELTPGKACEDPYTYSSDPLKKAYCAQLTPQDIAQYSCPTGFVGRPASFQRDSLSNDDFENTSCNGLNSYAYPEPL